jgi:hypothetical protein
MRDMRDGPQAPAPRAPPPGCRGLGAIARAWYDNTVNGLRAIMSGVATATGRLQPSGGMTPESPVSKKSLLTAVPC